MADVFVRNIGLFDAGYSADVIIDLDGPADRQEGVTVRVWIDAPKSTPFEDLETALIERAYEVLLKLPAD